jgi:hypothetical protein
MARSEYADHVVGQPKPLVQLAYHDLADISGLTFPAQVYLDGELEGRPSEGRDAEPAIVRSP